MKLSTILDVAGLLLLVLAAACFVYNLTASFPVALALTGLGVLLISYLAYRRGV